jgi:hypothetical protein
LETNEYYPLRNWEKKEGELTEVEPTEIKNFTDYQTMTYHTHSLMLEIIDGN